MVSKYPRTIENMARSKSSAAWLKEHFADPYVKKAQALGYRSRSAFKLLEMQEKYHLFKSGMVVVELGSAPGGWTQVLSSKVGQNNQIIALDILKMDPFADVTFIQGDFTEAPIREQIRQHLKGRKVDLVLSDMAPNMSGNRTVDQLKSMYLIELAYDFAKSELSDNGTFLSKVFYGAGFDEFLKLVKREWQNVRIYKPEASRSRSSECYLVASRKKAQPI